MKLYSFASVFRYERPQAGRYREHHQFNCEAIGDGDPALDAEVIDIAWQFYHSLNLQNLTLNLNSIGCKKCRPGYLAILKDHYSNYSRSMCSDCKVRFERNLLRLLDCKKPTCQQPANQSPRSADHLCPECKEHFCRLQSYLQSLEIPFLINHRLVRGLDYYTRTVFEIQPEDAGAQSTIGGGGRYDNLIEELGGKPTPAIGFASGIERIILNLKKQDISVEALPRPEVFIAFAGNEVKAEAIKLASTLRRKGIGVIVTVGKKSLKSQLRQANNLNAHYAIILGEEELKGGSVILRDMKTTEQKTALIEELQKILVK